MKRSNLHCLQLEIAFNGARKWSIVYAAPNSGESGPTGTYGKSVPTLLLPGGPSSSMASSTRL